MSQGHGGYERRGHHQRSPIGDPGDDIFFCFDPALSLRDIDLEIQAYEEVFGEGHLALVVIDNLLNMNTGDAGDFAALIDSLSALHSLARAKDVAVLVLHHVNVRDGQRAHDYPHR